MIRRLTIPVVLKVRGPVITKSSSIGAPGLDAVMAKASFEVDGKQQDCYYLPGSLVKGLLREAWQELAAVDGAFAELPKVWLGGKSPDGERNEPERGRMWFSDFHDPETDTDGAGVRFRIAIDEERGAADEGKLQLIESPYGAGQPIEFRGEVRMLLKAGESAEDVVARLQQGLQWVRAVGGTRTAGFGEVAGIELGKPAVKSPDGKVEGGAAWNLSLRFEDPVVISKHRISENLFESAEVIPGGAIKGAVAEVIAQAGGEFAALREELHAVRFQHAFPAERDKPRPVKWPASLIRFGDKREDAIEWDGPIPRRGDDGRPVVGKFEIDWKDAEIEKNARAFGWPKLKTELRVRTGIHGESRRAEDDKLFAWIGIVPYGYEWLGTVDASGCSEEAQRQLEQVLRFGLDTIGKRKSRCTVTLDRVVDAGVVEAAGEYRVTLQTAALLADPSAHLAPDGGLGSSEEPAMRREYEDAWRDLSGGSLELVSYFHRNSLAGGNYFRARFQNNLTKYKPYLLTDAGSVFRLKAVAGREADAAKAVAGWLKGGLPVRPSVAKFYEFDKAPGREWWKHCPFLPENGYGEITVNQALPEEKKACTETK